MNVIAPTSEGLRIGAVSYLNSKPLIHGLAQALPAASLYYDLPSRLADGLALGDLDVALVPIVEYLRQPSYQLVSTSCVACFGPVLSVKLYFRRPPGEVRTLALDEGSRTSAALAQVLLAELHGVRPELTKLPIGDTPADTQADAVLLIGDRAMCTPESEFCEVWDLGDRWCRWTELPFVFAAWVARPDLTIEANALAETLDRVRDAGVASIDAIAETESKTLGINADLARAYLTRNLHFALGHGERLAVEQFASHCHSLGLVPGPHTPRTISSSNAPTAYDDCSTH